MVTFTAVSWDPSTELLDAGNIREENILKEESTLGTKAQSWEDIPFPGTPIIRSHTVEQYQCFVMSRLLKKGLALERTAPNPDGKANRVIPLLDSTLQSQTRGRPDLAGFGIVDRSA